MPNSQDTKAKLVFFGTSSYAVMVLERLVSSGFSPLLVVTTPDKPVGRNLEITSPPVKTFAEENGIEVIQPETLRDPELVARFKAYDFDGGIVVAYGKIIPDEIIGLPKRGLLNVHASFLPKLRGASPIETTILLDEKRTGVTVMKIDRELDHGPIVAQEEVTVEPWPPQAGELGTKIVEAGANLLAKILPDWLAGTVSETPQDHTQATHTKKIEKSDGLINLEDDPYKNFLKIQAYHEWPTAYFFIERNGKKMRVIIKKASYEDGKLEIERVVPEGKKEMSYADFKRSFV